jgi:hypothetical protein
MPARCERIRRCSAWGRRKRSCLKSSKLCMMQCSKSTLRSQTIPVRARVRAHARVAWSFFQFCCRLCVCMYEVPPSPCAPSLCSCDADEMARVFLLAVGGLIRSWAPSDPTDAADVVRCSLPPSLPLSLPPSLTPCLSLALPPAPSLSLSLSLSHTHTHTHTWPRTSDTKHCTRTMCITNVTPVTLLPMSLCVPCVCRSQSIAFISVSRLRAEIV